jgi:uncharacterized protein YigE (DUF2233 family)
MLQNNIIRYCFIFFLILQIIISALLGCSNSGQNLDSWAHIEPGLALGIFDAPILSDYGDSHITVLRINPQFYKIDIYCESYYGGLKRTPRQWAEQFKLKVAINAGMYATDYITSVGYLKSGSHLNNPHLNSHHKTVFACGPLDPNIPAAQVIDLNCDDFNLWRDKYSSFSQCIRMINCQQENVWEPQAKKWSIACIGMDKSANLLLIHCRSPYSVHEFINMLLELPLNILNTMYLEGGPAASLYFSLGGIEKELVGSHEASFMMGENNQTAWSVPNIIGIKNLEKQKK